MAELWRASRWVRLHDWDWINGPLIPRQEEWSRKRSLLVPSKFFYHVLRIAEIKQVRLEYFSGPIRALEYDVVCQQIFDFFATPRPFGDFLREFPAHDYPREQWENITARLRLLRETKMLVRDDDPEPPDCRAVFKAALFLFGIWQLEDEFAPALEQVASLRPETIVEIGTGWGGSLFSLAQVAHPAAHLVSVDMSGGAGGGGYTREYAPRFRQFCFPEQQLTCVLNDSTDPAVVAHVREALDGRPVDVLFLDGAHTYDGVRRDFENYSPMVRAGGCVLFHDIAHPDDEEPSELMQVERFWREVTEGREHLEFIRDDPDGYHLGVGLLRM